MPSPSGRERTRERLVACVGVGPGAVQGEPASHQIGRREGDGASEATAPSGRLGGKEGITGPLQGPRGQAYPIVLEAQERLGICGLCENLDGTAPGNRLQAAGEKDPGNLVEACLINANVAVDLDADPFEPIAEPSPNPPSRTAGNNLRTTCRVEGVDCRGEEPTREWGTDP